MITRQSSFSPTSSLHNAARATICGVSGSVCLRSGIMAEGGDQAMIEMHPPGPGIAECAIKMEQEKVMIAACVATHK